MMVSSSGIFSLLLSAPVLLSFHTMPVTAQESLSDGNIRSAVQMWINNGEEAEMLYGRIEDWDVSRVTNFTSLFDSTVDFSADLGAWNTASVTTLRAAFYNSVGFSANIAAWDTSKVTDMRVMLAYASDFSSDISQWNVQNVQTMLGTFTYYSYSSEKTDSSNDETIAISGWNTDSLMDMEGLFAGTSYFHTDLSSWTTSKVSCALCYVSML